MPLPYNRRTCYCGDVGTELIGQSALLAGWVQNRRDHGGMVFIDLRDRAGLVQLKFNPETDPDAHQLSGRLRSEFCIVVRGDVTARPPEMVKKDMKTGSVEVEVRELEILSETPPPKFEIIDDLDVSEELRLKYRYLDLRRGPMQRALRTRHRIIKTIRDHFDAEGFVEIETPILTKSTPEGARDYLVPSRVHPGAFYALPQSPQIFKQLLMIGGFDKYVQIARCFRDEDLRADRQPEFTQLDMEMSFVQPEDVFAVIEGCMVRVMKAIHDIDMPRPFPRMTFAEAMRDFGSDAPDTRYGLKLIDLSDIAAKTEFGVFTKAIESGGVVRAICVPGGADMSRKELDGLVEELRGIGAGGMPYVKVAEEGGKCVFRTGAAKFFSPEAIAAVCEASGAKPGDALCFAADSETNVCRFLSWLRSVIARRRKLIPEGQWHFTWIVDMPMFEFNEEDQRWYSMHHPFTAPCDEDIPLLDGDLGKVRSQGYDLVLNGTELGSGSIRIHRADVQRRIFELLRISPEEQQSRFGFLLEALRHSPPPHGGIALGLDRIVMLLTGADSLRETFSFPKNAKAYCPLTEAPSPVSQDQLDDLCLKLDLPDA